MFFAYNLKIFKIYNQKYIIRHSFLGPCSFDEIFFPVPSPTTPKSIGSCFKIKFDGQSRFGDVNDICMDSYSAGSQRSTFSKRDPEYGLLMGSLDFLDIRSITKR